MKNTKPNAERVWKQLEDSLIPRLSFSVVDRAVYSHLLRHSRLEGKRRLRFSILWLARGVRLTGGPVREAVRRLVGQGALRLVERSKAGHVIEVRLPEEIPGVCPVGIEAGGRGNPDTRGARAINLEEVDFLQTLALRRAIHAREQGVCFYCMRRITARMQCLDHVVPRVQMGRNSYRNLVSCCLECNSRKGETAAGDFLRGLYREGRLSGAELTERLRAIDALASGKLRPALPVPVRCHPPSRKRDIANGDSARTGQKRG